MGVLGYRWFRHLGWMTSPLIFLMLFCTFCKIDPLSLRFHRWHFVVLGVQLGLASAAYGLLSILHCPESIIQSLILCIIMPTATAAPIIAGKLGGSIQQLTTFTLLSNFLTALIVPTLFPLLNPSIEIGFWFAAKAIVCRVAPLLIGPFALAWIVRILISRLTTSSSHSLVTSLASSSFYLWILLLVVLMARITHTLLTWDYSSNTIFILCVGGLVCCVLQFILGWWIGRRFPVSNKLESRVTAGQAFGQKNTALGIWMAQMFLHPLAALAPAAYIIWQNLLNSYQLWKAGKEKSV